MRRQRAEHEVERLRGKRQRAAIALDEHECRRHRAITYVQPRHRRLDDAGAGVHADGPALVPAFGSPREKGGREVGAAGANIEQRDAAMPRERTQARLQVAADERPTAEPMIGAAQVSEVAGQCRTGRCLVEQLPPLGFAGRSPTEPRPPARRGSCRHSAMMPGPADAMQPASSIKDGPRGGRLASGPVRIAAFSVQGVGVSV